jgi:hypothetical protein
MILGANPEEIELNENGENHNGHPDNNGNGNGNHTSNGFFQKLIENQQAEILFLKETISYQRQLLNELSKEK